MDQATETKVLEALYDRLFQAVTYAPGSQQALFDKKTTFIQFAKNQALNPQDFANPLSPVNPAGNLNSSELFSRMVDIQPSLNSDYTPTTNNVSKTYKSIVDGAISKLVNDPAQLALYQKAYDFLNKSITIEDFTGAKSTSVQPTAIYNSYQNNRTANVAALAAYRTAYLGYDLTKIADQRAWQANEPLLANAVSSTYNTWRSQGATQVEQALAVLASSINNIVANTIEAAQKMMLTSSMASSMGNPQPWFLAYATPTNWFDNSGLSNFSTLKLTSENLTKTADSSYTDYSAGGSASWGLWKVSAEVGGSNKESHEHMQADKFELSAKIAVVQINRPWMNDLIFKLKGWSMLGQPAGSVSNGELKGNSANTLPIIPTAFIVARDIGITANWTTEDKSHVESAIKTKASVGWGPFAVNGSFAHGTSKDYFNSTFNGGTLTIPGIQVIGWVNQITPFSAPLAG